MKALLGNLRFVITWKTWAALVVFGAGIAVGVALCPTLQATARSQRTQVSVYQVDRPPPCLVKWPRSTSRRNCCFSVLRLAPVNRTISPMLTRPWSRA